MREPSSRQPVPPVQSLRGSEATLNEQLARDPQGRLRDAVLDELAIATRDIETALQGQVVGKDAQVLRDLLDAIRVGEAVVTEVWHSFHG
jgi:hypothetical protein